MFPVAQPGLRKQALRGACWRLVWVCTQAWAPQHWGADAAHQAAPSVGAQVAAPLVGSEGCKSAVWDGSF